MKPRIDFTQDALLLAPRLLNSILVRRLPKGEFRGRIVEVEAYREDDPASHAFGGPSLRSNSLFKRGGHAYVYQIYGMHYCLNIVSGPEGHGQGVLIRAVEPILGFETMARNRGVEVSTSHTRWHRSLCSGPAKICQAMKIDLRQNGLALDPKGEIHVIADDELPLSNIVRSPRIGITKAADLPWRFTVRGSCFLSRKV